ncbi:MAG: hypothetical protein HC882_02860 [Acidobacteria bacterium]|nr:hypothetical protein [Acidobacteriota bacterium]
MKLAAARLAAREIAEGIVEGRVDPFDGATIIWKRLLEDLDEPIPDDLWPFKSNASAIEDCIFEAERSGSNYDALIARCRQEIVDAARALIESK